MEVYANLKINKIMEKHISPNFINMFCHVYDDKRAELNLQFERFDLSYSYAITKGIFKYKHLESCLFQVLHAIYVMKKRMKINHNDLHTGNILVKKIPYSSTNTKYWKYKVDNKYYYVPSNGFVIGICDFGVSTNLKNSKSYLPETHFDVLSAMQQEFTDNINNNENIKNRTKFWNELTEYRRKYAIYTPKYFEYEKKGEFLYRFKNTELHKLEKTIELLFKQYEKKVSDDKIIEVYE
jgi:predicted unusual protein kinase regulating ubiquinone biosynthesis (AarF/ABC1/UbiB family)